MVHKSLNLVNRPKKGYIVTEIVCILYGFFTCITAWFGIVILTLGRLLITSVIISDGDSTIITLDSYKEGMGIKKDLTMDFTFKYLNWDTLPITGYGVIFYFCFTSTMIYSFILCYGIYERNPAYLKQYTAYGDTVTSLMFLALFYLYVWFTEYWFYSVLATANALYIHMTIRRIIRKSFRLFRNENNTSENTV